MILATLAAFAVMGQPVNVNDRTLSIVTFNLRYGTADDHENAWPLRREFVFDLLRQQKADVIGLQEALHMQVEEIKTALPEYAAIGVGRDDGKEKGEYAAIFFDTRKLKVEDSGTFWLSDTPEVKGSNTWKAGSIRICTWARFTRINGQSFTMYNLHLDNESEMARQKGVELVAQRINGRKIKDAVILTGDFNAGEHSNAIMSVRTLTGLEDTYRKVHANDKEVGTYNAFKLGETHGEKIDYIFASPSLRVREARIIRTSKANRYASDHFPVTAKIDLEDE